eukprot:5797006-Prymnesium_polylepis.1
MLTDALAQYAQPLNALGYDESPSSLASTRTTTRRCARASTCFLWHVRDPTKYEGIASLTALERHDPD